MTFFTSAKFPNGMKLASLSGMRVCSSRTVTFIAAGEIAEEEMRNVFNCGIGNFREGSKHREESKRLIGSYHKGKVVSEETKDKLRNANKGKKWWHNGVECKHAFECPGPEWKLGRIIKRTRR